MLQIEGTIGIRTMTSGYLSYFNYVATRFDDRPDGDISQVAVRPQFPGLAKPLYTAFDRENPRTTALAEKGQVFFEVNSATQDWKPVPAYYEFVDKQGRLLGAIPMPAFLNGTVP